MHVAPRVVGAVVVAEAVQYGFGFELVFVCDFKNTRRVVNEMSRKQEEDSQ